MRLLAKTTEDFFIRLSHAAKKREAINERIMNTKTTFGKYTCMLGILQVPHALGEGLLETEQR